MSHQDWETVIVRGNVADNVKKTSSKKIVTSHSNQQGMNVTVKKIYDSENPNAEPEIRPVMIDKEFSKKMIQARLAKKLTQKELANAISLDVKIINQYEQSGGVRNGAYVSKIKNFLKFS
jgi:ribosome-binding protein aMBF1 (putative translation factor)